MVNTPLDNINELLRLSLGDKYRLEDIQRRLIDGKTLYISDNQYLEKLVTQYKDKIQKVNISKNDYVSFASIDEYQTYMKSTMNSPVNESPINESPVNERNDEIDHKANAETNMSITICLQCDTQLTKEQKVCPNCGVEISLMKEYLAEDNTRLQNYEVNKIMMETLHTIDNFNKLTDEKKFHWTILRTWEEIKNKMNEVDSSNMKSIGYDSSTESLFVKFKDNSIYVYFEVPEITYKDFLDSSSKGGYHHEFIRNNFEFFNITKILH
jgi:hypothetical protein